MADVVPGKTITREQLDSMFENIEANTDWDMSQPMLWGYFFTHHSREGLDAVGPLLEAEGYRVVEVYQADRGDEGAADVWVLHIEKAEIHSPATLDARNDEHYRFAYQHGLRAYDGMDVGPVG